MPPEFGDVIYKVEVITMYKQGEGETYAEGSEITFTTKASSSLCGIPMYVGDDAEGNEREYLLDLSRVEGSNTTLRAKLCGVFGDWVDVDVPLLESCASTPPPAPLMPSSAPSTPFPAPSTPFPTLVRNRTRKHGS